MKISNEMIAQIKALQGYSLSAYLDDNGKPTIGIGHRGSDVSMGDRISTEECDRLFREDIFVAERAVTKLNTRILDRTRGKVSFDQQQFDALVDLVNNVGVNCIRQDSVVFKVLMNNGTFDTLHITHAFMHWAYKDGKLDLKLAKRLAIDCAWYVFGSDWEQIVEKRKITDIVRWARD